MLVNQVNCRSNVMPVDWLEKCTVLVDPLKAGMSKLFHHISPIFAAFMLATQLNSLVEEERLSAQCICQVNRFIVNSLKDGRYVRFFK